MPKRRSVVPGYTKRLQRTMRKLNVPNSVVAHAPDMHAKPLPDDGKLDSNELDTECFTGGQHDDPKEWG